MRLLYQIHKQKEMSYELNTITNTKKSFPKNTRFSFEDFLIACPFSISYLREKNRKQEVMQWRQVGMAWYAIEFNSITQAGKFFDHNHSTVIHSLKCIKDRKWNPSLASKVNKVIDLMELEVKNSNDINEKELNSLLYLERLIKKKLAFVEK
jgi:hypothetical protein